MRSKRRVIGIQMTACRVRKRKENEDRGPRVLDLMITPTRDCSLQQAIRCVFFFSAEKQMHSWPSDLLDGSLVPRNSQSSTSSHEKVNRVTKRNERGEAAGKAGCGRRIKRKGKARGVTRTAARRPDPLDESPILAGSLLPASVSDAKTPDA